MIRKRRIRLNSFQFIVLGFAAVIIVGALLLMLPLSSSSGVVTPLNETLFTATTSVCVTGLVVQDTGTYWSLFGQIVIILLIQIGGLGVVIVAAFFVILSRKKISLMQRTTMQEVVAAPKISGIVKLVGFAIKATLIIELIGAIVMAPVFRRDFGIARGIWFSIFHSISAFCNAGIDLMGVRAPYSSLTSYSANPLINIPIMLLIIIGGIGFLTWEDIKTNRHHIGKYRMQSKVILSVTAALILLPAIFFFFVDYSHLPLGERLLCSFFQSVTPRTAGFNTTDLNAMSSASKFITILLMLIGGSPGSTAGGIKTTTLAVLVACSISVFRRREDTLLYKRRIDVSAVQTAVTILLLYLALFFFGAVSISLVENLPMEACLYETASAIGTVGLSLGITPTLSIFSRFVLIILMFFGRVGGLTIIYSAISGARQNLSKFPLDKITIG